MSFAKGRDDEPEELGKKLDQRKEVRDKIMSFFHLGVQYAQQADSGSAEAEVVLRLAAKTAEEAERQDPQEKRQRTLAPPKK